MAVSGDSKSLKYYCSYAYGALTGGNKIKEDPAELFDEVKASDSQGELAEGHPFGSLEDSVNTLFDINSASSGEMTESVTARLVELRGAIFAASSDELTDEMQAAIQLLDQLLNDKNIPKPVKKLAVKQLTFSPQKQYNTMQVPSCQCGNIFRALETLKFYKENSLEYVKQARRETVEQVADEFIRTHPQLAGNAKANKAYLVSVFSNEGGYEAPPVALESGCFKHKFTEKEISLFITQARLETEPAALVRHFSDKFARTLIGEHRWSVKTVDGLFIKNVDEEMQKMLAAKADSIGEMGQIQGRSNNVRYSASSVQEAMQKRLAYVMEQRLACPLHQNKQITMRVKNSIAHEIVMNGVGHWKVTESDGSEKPLVMESLTDIAELMKCRPVVIREVVRQATMNTKDLSEIVRFYERNFKDKREFEGDFANLSLSHAKWQAMRGAFISAVEMKLRKEPELLDAVCDQMRKTTSATDRVAMVEHFRHPKMLAVYLELGGTDRLSEQVAGKENALVGSALMPNFEMIDYLSDPQITLPKLPKAMRSQLALQCAAFGASEAFRKLTAAGIEQRKFDSMGYSFVHLASMNGHLGMIELLGSARGFALNVLTKQSRENALHLAIRFGHQNIIGYLLSVPNLSEPETANGASHTPLMLAAIQESELIFRTLIDHPKISVDGRDNQGRTLLHHLAENGRQQMINVFAGKYQAKLNYQSKERDGTNRLPRALAIANQHHNLDIPVTA
ncbi:MAG: ankyrin repeat domain-containing protein [Parashewanella sp.]